VPALAPSAADVIGNAISRSPRRDLIATIAAAVAWPFMVNAQLRHL
jgi:hypothetical protein